MTTTTISTIADLKVGQIFEQIFSSGLRFDKIVSIENDECEVSMSYDSINYDKPIGKRKLITFVNGMQSGCTKLLYEQPK